MNVDESGCKRMKLQPGIARMKVDENVSSATYISDAVFWCKLAARCSQKCSVLKVFTCKSGQINGSAPFKDLDDA